MDPAPVALVAEQLGLSPMEVMKIERQALAKCRTWCRTHGVDRAAVTDHPGRDDERIEPRGADL